MAADLVSGSKVSSTDTLQKVAQSSVTAAAKAAAASVTAQVAPASVPPKKAATPPQYQTGFDPPPTQRVALNVPDKAAVAANEDVPSAGGAIPTHIDKTPYDMDQLQLANSQYGSFNQIVGNGKGAPANPTAAAGMAMGFLTGQSGNYTYQSVFVGNLAANGQAESVLGAAWNDPSNHNSVLQGVNASREATQGGATGITDDQLRGWATNGPYATQWAQIARGLTPPLDVYSTDEQRQATTQVTTAQTAYTNAQRETQKLDDTMNQELARIGPGLTDAQRKAYIDAYKGQHKDEYAAEAKAAGDLQTALSNPAFQFAAQSDPAAAKKLVTGYEALASSPSQGKAALEWAGQAATLLHDHPDSPEAKALIAGFGASNAQGALTQLGNEVVQPGMSSAFSELSVENGSDKAFEQLKDLVEPFKNIKEICSTPGEITEAFETGRKLAQAAANGTLTEAQLASLGEKYAKMSPVARGFARASVALGALSAAQAGRQGEYGDMVKNALSTTKSGLELAAGATQTLAETGKLAQLLGEEGARSAVGLAELGAKLAPALGAMVNGIAFVQDIQGAAKDKSAGLVIAAVGDAIGMLGIIPGGGEVFSAIGAGVSALGTLIDYHQQQGAQSEEEKKLLAQVAQDPSLKLDPRIAGIYSGGDVRTAQLAQLGISPEQIQAYALKNPDLMDYGTTGILVNAAQQLGVSGSDFFTFLDRVAQETPSSDKPSLLGAVSQLNQLWNDTQTGPLDTVSHQQRFREAFARAYPNTQQFVSGIQNADPRQDH